jgi:formate-dependent nitrite reductase cytochrome c552 subunit
VRAAEAESMSPSTVRQLAAIVLGSLVGLGVGMASYTFLYAQGWSYLTNNPATCTNCHIMQDHYDARVKSSHRAVATCNDCHTPANIVAKYYTKAARAAGRTDEQLAPARDFQRKAQFYLDFIEAENSMGFHAPQEAARILGASINFSRQGERVLWTLL